MIFLGAGIVEVQPADATARSSLPSGGTRHLDWGTEVWTGPRTRTLVVLPEKGGEVVLSPESKVRLDRDGVVVTAGEARVTVPHRGENPLQVETPRGRLEIQPGGEARVRPREFARVRGEVARVGQG